MQQALGGADDAEHVARHAEQRGGVEHGLVALGLPAEEGGVHVVQLALRDRAALAQQRVHGVEHHAEAREAARGECGQRARDEAGPVPPERLRRRVEVHGATVRQRERHLASLDGGRDELRDRIFDGAKQLCATWRLRVGRVDRLCERGVLHPSRLWDAAAK